MPTLTQDRPENHNFLKRVLYPTVQTTNVWKFLQCSWRLCYGAGLCLWVLWFYNGLYVYSKALGREGCVENLNVEVEDPAGKDEEVWNPCEIRRCGRETAHPN